MAKKVLFVGHCGPDSSYLRMAVTSAVKGTQVLAADTEEELDHALAEKPDLILFNRLLDYGFPESEGVHVIRRLRATHPELRMMLVSNYDDAQAAAVKAGALPGFGKREIGSPRVTDLLKNALVLRHTLILG